MTKLKKRLLIFFVILSVLIALLIVHIFVNVNPVIEQVSAKEVKTLATVAVNTACDEVLTQYFIDDMIDYVLDNSGDLQLITTNTALMNSISRKAIEISQKRISSLGERGIPIPLGSLTGITVFSGQGPNVYIKVFPIGEVSASFVSEFVSAGINQTRHKISLCINADIRVVMPGADNVVTTATQILLCENLIMGKVPDTYLSMQNLSDLLNLTP